ncbi:MAG: hypothetical protein PHN45_04550 [Methylococcales bacterium]|nr:hypothetical protein [Methylococcales bacterium]MDD5754006.1 hypothetical protein [Methylococcales bacterium]
MINRRIFVGIFITVFTTIASADYSFYEGDHGELSAGLQIQTAIFGDVNNQAGGAAKANLTDYFWELSAKPYLNASLNLFNDSKLYGGFSYVYSSTLGHDPSGYTQKGVDMYLQETDYTTLGRYDNYHYKNKTEELYLGWKSGKLLDEDEKITVDLSGGRQNYKLGSGFLLNYGADNGGNRGAGWINPRTAFNNTILGRFNFEAIKLEGFYLETRPLNPAEKRSYQGANLEYAYSDSTHFALSYIKTGNKRSLHDDGSTDSLGKQGLDNDTYNARVEFSPLENFTISTEYAYQINSTKIATTEFIDKTKIHASGGFGQIEYKREDLFWQPAISYRYAIQGEGFDSMSPGFGTWGTWFQGEITGEWMLDNSNLVTHVGRLIVTPVESVTLNLIYINFTFVNPAAFALTSANYGNEVNLLADWEFSDALEFSTGLEAFVPSAASKQYLGEGNKVWLQGFLTATFTF